MFWKKWSWSTRIVSVLGAGLLAAIFYPVFALDPYKGGRRSSCQSNLKVIGPGFLQYEQDYDEHFPPIITGGSAYGWADALQPYLKSTQVYQCPTEPNKFRGTPDPLQNGCVDYPFNANLERKSARGIAEVSLQVLSLDGNDGLEVTNARYCLTQIPPAWRSDKTSPLYRHLETANYLFADGHVKSMKPADYFSNNDIVF